jgi:hypothetical protein
MTQFGAKVDARMHGASPAFIASDVAATSEISVAKTVNGIERDQFM